MDERPFNWDKAVAYAKVANPFVISVVKSLCDAHDAKGDGWREAPLHFLERGVDEKLKEYHSTSDGGEKLAALAKLGGYAALLYRRLSPGGVELA